GFPLSFNSVESLNITKGPASIIYGAGPGVGGSVDLITKRPYFDRFRGNASATFDTESKRKWNVDIGAPIVKDQLAYRMSYTGEESDGYYLNQLFRQHSVYGALSWTPNDRYTLEINTEGIVAEYTENVGINRVNQDLIDNGTYLTGTPTQTILANFFSGGLVPPFPVGVPGNPYAGATSILTQTNLTGTVGLDRRRTLSSIPGDVARGMSYNFQAIQTLVVDDDFRIRNNTFLNYEDRDKKQSYYYAQAIFDNISIENRTEFLLNFDIPQAFDDAGPIESEVNTGFSMRYTNVRAISNFNNEPASIYDVMLTDPSTWVFPDAAQIFGNAFPYTGPSGRTLFGVPARDGVNSGDTNYSQLYNGALFYQNRLVLSEKLSLFYGGRMDFLYAETKDPLGPDILNGLPRRSSTAVHLLPNVNVSPVYKLFPWMSTYLTYNYAQFHGTGLNGGVFPGGRSEGSYFHRESELLEGGFKFNLLDDSLFIGLAAFNQKRTISAGAAGQTTAVVDITGLEVEANYQPTKNFFVTASYSYINSELNSPLGFYNFPAQPGINTDGAGLFATFAPGQTFQRPGVPEHLFNFLANYEFDFGLGFNYGVQVIGPIDTTTSGTLLAGPFNAPGFYQSPRLPWQYEMNAAVYYKWRGWEGRLSFFNFTDEKNFNAANPFYGNDFLVANLPFRVEGTVKYSW
ncbi:MAG: hypothetical protein SNJ84_03890, partial [Verrucomicrobiia bacterium]